MSTTTVYEVITNTETYYTPSQKIAALLTFGKECLQTFLVKIKTEKPIDWEKKECMTWKELTENNHAELLTGCSADNNVTIELISLAEIYIFE